MIVNLKSGKEVDTRMFDQAIVHFVRDQDTEELRSEDEWTYTAHCAIKDHSTVGSIDLRLPGLTPSDCVEFHSMWAARRKEMKRYGLG